MSSQQATLTGFATESPDSPDGPEPAPEPDPEPAFDVPNFDREGGVERTELGAALDELCQRAREAPPAKRPRRRSPGDEQ